MDSSRGESDGLLFRVRWRKSSLKGSRGALGTISGDFWAPLGTLWELIFGKMTDFWRLFLGFFFKSGFGDVARSRGRRQWCAGWGGGSLWISLVRVSKGNFIRLRHGAADLSASGHCRRPQPISKIGPRGPMAPMGPMAPRTKYEEIDFVVLNKYGGAVQQILQKDLDNISKHIENQKLSNK